MDALIQRGWDANRVRQTVLVAGTAFGLGDLRRGARAHSRGCADLDQSCPGRAGRGCARGVDRSISHCSAGKRRHTRRRSESLRPDCGDFRSHRHRLHRLRDAFVRSRVRDCNHNLAARNRRLRFLARTYRADSRAGGKHRARLANYLPQGCTMSLRNSRADRNAEINCISRISFLKFLHTSPIWPFDGKDARRVPCNQTNSEERLMSTSAISTSLLNQEYFHTRQSDLEELGKALAPATCPALRPPLTTLRTLAKPGPLLVETRSPSTIASRISPPSARPCNPETWLALNKHSPISRPRFSKDQCNRVATPNPLTPLPQLLPRPLRARRSS